MKLKSVKELTSYDELSLELERSFKRTKRLKLQIQRRAKQLCAENPDVTITNIGVFGYTYKANELYKKRRAHYDFGTCLKIIKQIENQIS